MRNYIAQIWGTVNPPPGVASYSGGLATFVTNLVRLLIVAAGVWALFNLVFAGYAFMSAGGEPQKIASAWAKIWQTLLGLAISVGAFVLAAIFGRLLFGDYNALLQLRIFTP